MIIIKILVSEAGLKISLVFIAFISSRRYDDIFCISLASVSRASVAVTRDTF